MNKKEEEHVSFSDAKIQWHPGFCAAMELALRKERDNLEIYPEYNLSKKPLQIDALIVKRKKKEPIQESIGKIFRTHNVIEYKSPDDGLNIDDFFKTLAYAFLYKSLGRKTDEILLEELTVSLFRAQKPWKLIKRLEGYGYEITNPADGIYYVNGMVIPVQIIATKELHGNAALGLKVLTNSVQEEDVRHFLEYVNDFSETGDKENADAVLQVSISANQKMYAKVRREVNVCEALRELMKDEIDAEIAREVAKASEKARTEAIQQGRAEGLAKGREEGRAEGREEGRMEGENRLNQLYIMLEKDGRMNDISRAMKEPEFLQALYKEYGMA